MVDRDLLLWLGGVCPVRPLDSVSASLFFSVFGRKMGLVFFPTLVTIECQAVSHVFQSMVATGHFVTAELCRNSLYWVWKLSVDRYTI